MSKKMRPEGSAPAPYPVTLSDEQVRAMDAAQEHDSDERERLAQLGQRVVEILQRAEPRHWVKGTDSETIASELFPGIQGAARSLGFLDSRDTEAAK